MLPSFVVLLLVDGIAGIVFGEEIVQLQQGPLRGIRVYTSDRRAINAYLGIPYARPPIGELRFAPPERHPGWDDTLTAGTTAPSCPQTNNSVVGREQVLQSEDCLYLNVWTPAISTYRKWPVVIFLEGEEFSAGGGNRFSGQELAAEGGIVVVTLNYRLNVFGFLCFGDGRSRGNMGILDQYMALLWVRENIGVFGGDSMAITLMGHGAGAASGVFHLTSPRTRGLFHRIILMSGAANSPWLRVRTPGASSRAIARSLGCFEKSSFELLRCLRSKNTAELLSAFQEHHNNGNWTDLVSPVVDNFLPEQDQYLPKDPEEILESGDYNHIPILTGITSNEGGIILYHWRDLVRESYRNLRQFFEDSAMPLILLRYGYNTSVDGYTEFEELIKWRYLYGVNDGDSSQLLYKLVQLFSDAQFNAPHAKQLSLLATSSGAPAAPIYTYRFDQAYGPNPYGSTLPMPGAIHGSELLYLFGFRQMENRFNQPQAQLGKHMRRFWTNFINFGNPTPINHTHGPFWAPYTASRQETFHLRSDISAPASGDFNDDPYAVAERASLWNDLFPQLMEIHVNRTPLYVSPELREYTDSKGPLRSAVFALVGIVCLLVGVLLICLWLLRRRSRQLDHAELF